MVSYSLIGSNADTIDLDGVDYILEPGMVGLGIAPTSVRVEESAGNGGVWRHSKRLSRDVDLPITVVGTSASDVEAKLRRLAKLTQDRFGPTQLVATYEDESSLALELHYTGGAEGEWGENQGTTWARWTLSFKAPQPFWTSTSSETFTVTSGNTGRGLLPSLSKLLVSSSSALGVVSVDSTADVDSYPVWTIVGPITDFVASNGTQSFTIEGTIAAGETYFVDTEAGTVVNQSGENVYGQLGPAPKLFPIPPGQTTIQVSGEGTDTSTSIRCDYALRYEVVH